MITYESHLWKAASWRRQTRYYHCELRQNLFCTWIVTRAWGDIRSHRGREMTVYSDSYVAACQVFCDVEKRRKNHKYELVTTANLL